MNVLVVYAHHEASSLTSSLKNTSVSVLQNYGHTIVESDLYGQGFQATAEKIDFTVMSESHFNYMLEQKNASMNSWAFSPDIVEELQKLREADMIIFHFPVWWSSVPAILKGWFDRVLVKGVAWDDHGQTFDNGLLKGKKALLVTSTGEPETSYQKEGFYKATLSEMLQPITYGTLGLCGIEVLPLFAVYDAMNKTGEQVNIALDKYREYLTTTVGKTIANLAG